MKGFEAADIITDAPAHRIETNARHRDPAGIRGHPHIIANALPTADRRAHGVGAVHITVARLRRDAGPKVAIAGELAIRLEPVVIVVKTIVAQIAAILADQGWMAIGDTGIKTGDHGPRSTYAQIIPDQIGAHLGNIPVLRIERCARCALHCGGHGSRYRQDGVRFIGLKERIVGHQTRHIGALRQFGNRLNVTINGDGVNDIKGLVTCNLLAL